MRQLIPICLYIFMGSCIGPNSLQYSLNQYKVPLEYKFDSTIDSIKGDKRIYIMVIDKIYRNDSTKVKEDGFFVMPLIVAGGYKYDFTVTLGKESVQPSFSDFIYDSFKKEVLRSGDFIFNEKSFRSDYILEIILKECLITTKYHKDRVRVGLNSKENWILQPITGLFTIEVQFLKKKQVIFNKLYSSTKTSQLEVQRFNSEAQMNRKMMQDFANTASIEIKEILEAIISDINNQVQ